MYCKYCGNEVNENAVVCIKCGCAIEDRKIESQNNNQAQQQVQQSVLGTIAKVFMVLGCVTSAFFWLIPLCWTIPMTVSLFNKLNKNEPIGTGFKVCILLFCNLIAGILLLCMPNKTKTNQ